MCGLRFTFFGLRVTTKRGPNGKQTCRRNSARLRSQGPCFTKDSLGNSLLLCPGCRPEQNRWAADAHALAVTDR